MKVNPLIPQGSSLLVIGFGVSGQAVARYAVQCGASVYVSDCRAYEKLSAREREELQEYCTDWECGGNSLQFLEAVNIVFLSPGVPEELALVAEAQKKGIPVVGELALVAPVIKAQVVAVTGTNGKTTVTSLLGALFRADGKDVFVGGNIGTPLLDYLIRDAHPEVVVVELSSFQLDTLGSFRPDIALLLNITPDHIDRHKTFENYRNAKAKIFANQKEMDISIINSEDQYCCEIAERLHSQVLTFGHQQENAAYIHDASVSLSLENSIECYDVPRAFDNAIGRLNCAAAILAARKGGCSRDNIIRGLDGFRPLPHRVEPVAQIDDVFYCNDSKATNTGAVISALHQVQGRVILIAGGRDKGEDYGVLRRMVREKVRHLILIGESGPALAASLEDLVPFSYAADMEDAVHQGRRVAEKGDTVLLSPACSSFDMFSGYVERGEKFRAVVQAMQAHGEVK